MMVAVVMVMGRGFALIAVLFVTENCIIGNCMYLRVIMFVIEKCMFDSCTHVRVVMFVFEFDGSRAASNQHDCSRVPSNKYTLN